MWVAASVAGSSLLPAAIFGSGALGAGASIFGSMKQSQAANNAAQIQEQMFNTAQQNLGPFQQAGASVLPTLTKLLTPGADMSDVLSKIPGFEFAQKYGQKAITNQATSRGLSGNALTAGADYATGSANSAYTGILQALLGEAGIGGNAAAGVASAAGTAGGQIGGSTIAGGNAQAAGAVGAANALGGSVNSGINYQLLTSLLNKNNGGGGTGIFSGQQPGLGATGWSGSNYQGPVAPS